VSRDPIPLSVFHLPVCTSFAFFDVGKFMVIDPTEREELVANGVMVIAMNKHREICLLQMTGDMLLLQEQASSDVQLQQLASCVFLVAHSIARAHKMVLNV
jgi:exosome complex component RRP45